MKRLILNPITIAALLVMSLVSGPEMIFFDSELGLVKMPKPRKKIKIKTMMELYTTTIKPMVKPQKKPQPMTAPTSQIYRLPITRILFLRQPHRDPMF
jgi:hypothetical protein